MTSLKKILHCFHLGDLMVDWQCMIACCVCCSAVYVYPLLLYRICCVLLYLYLVLCIIFDIRIDIFLLMDDEFSRCTSIFQCNPYYIKNWCGSLPRTVSISWMLPKPFNVQYGYIFINLCTLKTYIS